MSEETKTLTVAEAPVSMEMLRYKEELAEKMGLPSPYGMQLMKQVCQDLVDSGMVPSHFANNPMAVFAAAMRGREMGLNPMESVMETFWAAPGKRLGMYAAKMLDLMHRGGVLSEFLREDAEACEILFTPPPPHKPYTAKFNIAEATAAGLVKQDSNWNKWRSDMNKARAVSRGWRALLGTFKGGTANIYSKEEMEDTGMLDSTTDDPSAADAARLAQIKAQEEKYTVRLKPKAEVTVDVQSDVQSEAASPAPVTPTPMPPPPQPAPVPESAQSNVGPEAPEEFFEIYRLFPNAGGDGKLKPVLCEGENQKHRDAAGLRAQALANGSGMEHAAVRVLRTAEGKEERSECFRAKPPAKKERAPAATQAATQTAETAATPAEPAKPAPAKATPASPSPETAAVILRMEALAKVLNIPAKTASSRFNAFLAGYLGISVKELKDADKAERYRALDALEAVVNYDANEFSAGPEEAGKRSRERGDAIRAYLTGLWGKGDPSESQLRQQAIEMGCRLAQQHGNTPAEFQSWISFHAIELDFKPMADVHAILRMLLRTRDAVELIKLGKAHNLALAPIVDQIEKRALDGATIEAAPVTAIKAAIVAFVKATKDEARKAAEVAPEMKPEMKPEPKPEPVKAKEPAPAEPEDANLFGDDWANANG